MITIKTTETRSSSSINWYFPSPDEARAITQANHSFGATYSQDGLQRIVEIRFDDLNKYHTYHLNPVVTKILNEKNTYNVVNKITTTVSTEHGD